MTRAVCAALLVGVFLGTGCPGVLQPPERPWVRVQEVSAAADRAGQVFLHVQLGATNPNAVALFARALDWEVALAGARPWRGRTALSFGLPARGSATWDIALVIPAGAAGDMASRLRSGSREYQVSGTLHFAGERRDVSSFIDEQGAVTWTGEH